MELIIEGEIVRPVSLIRLIHRHGVSLKTARAIVDELAAACASECVFSADGSPDRGKKSDSTRRTARLEWRPEPQTFLP